MRSTFSRRFWRSPIRMLTFAGVLFRRAHRHRARSTICSRRGRLNSRGEPTRPPSRPSGGSTKISRAPGFEAARTKLEPILAFYRGANQAALGKKEDARREFEKYLAAVPNARLDPAMFPKAVIEVFNDVREKVPPPPKVPAAGDTGMTPTTHFFPEERDGPTAFPDERWAEGPIRYFVDEGGEAGLARPPVHGRAGGIRPPLLATAGPGAEGERIERRLRFADLRFKQGETRGSETDRGLVFVLLGPPS